MDGSDAAVPGTRIAVCVYLEPGVYRELRAMAEPLGHAAEELIEALLERAVSELGSGHGGTRKRVAALLHRRR